MTFNQKIWDEKYPECAKFRLARDEAAVLTRFVDWLEGQGIVFCTHAENGRQDYWSIGDTTEKLFMRYFEIDAEKLERERRTMLESTRSPEEFDNVEMPNELLDPALDE